MLHIERMRRTHSITKLFQRLRPSCNSRIGQPAQQFKCLFCFPSQIATPMSQHDSRPALFIHVSLVGTDKKIDILPAVCRTNIAETLGARYKNFISVYTNKSIDPLHGTATAACHIAAFAPRRADQRLYINSGSGIIGYTVSITNSSPPYISVASSDPCRLMDRLTSTSEHQEGYNLLSRSFLFFIDARNRKNKIGRA